jgi:hypothetical protein
MQLLSVLQHKCKSTKLVHNLIDGTTKRQTVINDI